MGRRKREDRRLGLCACERFRSDLVSSSMATWTMTISLERRGEGEMFKRCNVVDKQVKRHQATTWRGKWAVSAV